MFQIKICGITSIEDARVSILAGADAIGLNFVEGSKRQVDINTAQQIAAVAKGHATLVGIFVNSTADDIRQISDHLGLDYVQLHGDEQAEFCSELPGRSVIKAFRYGGGGASLVAEYLSACLEGGVPEAILIDGFKPGEYGGTGEVVDWKTLAQLGDLPHGLPIVLAGGLTSANVGQAISIVRPTAVDTASGVESAAGIKDPQRVNDFVHAAKQGFALLDR